MARLVVLDRETCFKKWVDLGTQKRVSKWFADQGVINSFTGKPYSVAAISFAARRWVCENASEAREYYRKAGWEPNDRDWNDWLVRTMVKCFHSHRRRILRELLRKENLLESHGYVIGE